MPEPKVVIDTNIFVSSLINPHGLPAQVINAWTKDAFSCIVPLPLIKEVNNVLRAPRIKSKYNITDDKILRFIEFISFRAHWVVLKERFKLCRHTSDDLILETAVIGEAEYLVTRDDDIKRDLNLITQMRAHGITVVTIRVFLELLDKNKLNKDCP